MDFTRKSRWVLDGHNTPDPVGSNYTGAVSRKSVRISFTYAASNNLDVFDTYGRSSYLQVLLSKNNYIICGPEFGLENVGRLFIMHRSLYGDKSVGRDLRNYLASCMSRLDFVVYPVDLDVWIRPANKSDGLL